jgi:hypothetical protein
MDVEGAKVDAIPGASRVIAAHRLVMARCAYHRCADLWAIPNPLKAAIPDHWSYLRRYAEEWRETVY